MQVLAVLHKAGKPASEVCRRFEPVPQVLRNVRFKGGRPLENPAVTKAIAEATARLGDRGRLLVRPSGTEPVIRVMGRQTTRRWSTLWSATSAKRSPAPLEGVLAKP